MAEIWYVALMDISEKAPQHYEQSITFESPWLQFKRAYWPSLSGDADSDVAIVGGGISGVVTLYYLLTETTKNVILLEKEKIAGQATGNNAGLACIHIERPIQDLVEEFGLEKTRQSFLEVDQSWELMVSILDTIDAQELLQPLPSISLAMTSVEVLLGHIEREKYNRAFGRTKWHYYVVDDLQVPLDDTVEIHYISKSELLQKLDIVDDNFIAVAVPQDTLPIGRLNSAKFCHRILDYLTTHYPERFCVYEETPIHCIQQQHSAITLIHPNGQVTARDVILCTNGYKNFEIRTQAGAKLQRLHNALTPREGYMAAFTDTKSAPYAQAFFDDRGIYADSPYFYLSHTHELTVLGGPEFDQPDGLHTQELIAKRAATSQAIYHTFLKNTYNIKDQPFSHFWYGIMGYTANGVRWVGQEPELQQLWYNLGCNGIGITTSIGAAKRVVALLQGKTLPPAIFDGY